ncbi:RluA family pseudouridine synthase [Longirhabdus pacifica]|uniref:RluA family pseudouridine synthase n=1 Tax=Longirhabdus pacifica TaxID=2305227 RepID=UPI001008D408|nr:RNA pseudouridine synthase [Longirhabdus pacifica]
MTTFQPIILFEDNHVLVVEKPVNMLSQADDSKDLDLLTALKQFIKKRNEKPGNVYLGLVHRLDRPVGGAMVFAKTSKAASRLSDQVRTRNMNKTYLAVVHGQPKQAEATLQHYLVKNEKENKVYVGNKHTPKAKEASLTYTMLHSNDAFSLLRIALHTGRPHQIRVQCATIGCPLFGDQKYGAELNHRGQQIALWSHQLAFIHPTKKERVAFTSSPPATFPWDLWNVK